ncbi:phosphotransferase family protein [Schumannella luteola]
MTRVSPESTTVLDRVTAVDLARRLGLDVDAETAQFLSGGVSSAVVSIDGRPPVILKQALSRLNVPAVWDADPARSETEADAVRLLHSITPDHVPELLGSDSDAHVIAVRRAPDDWSDWRSVLLAGPDERDITRATTAGAVLGTWHAATWDDASVRSSFDRAEAFEELRLDPFHRELLRRDAAPAVVIEPLIDELTGTRECLVHGDFSPKNVLVGDPGLWVIDAEVAHAGAAVFDLAFLVAHLAVKSIHSRADAPLLRRAAEAFVSAYERANPRRVAVDRVVRHAAAVMLARVVGKSPAAYLSDAEGAVVVDVALQALASEHPGLDALWPAAEGRS